MASDKPYRIRRAIVTALYGYTGAQDLDTVAYAPEVLIENLTPDMLRAEWDNLIAAGILEPLPGYQGAVAKLAPGIRQQMQQANGHLPPLPALWGHRVM